MDTIPPSDDWPAFLNFIREWIFVPGVAIVGWFWTELRQVKKDQRESLERIELGITKIAEAFNAHALDDLRRFASKEDLAILRADVMALRSHMDERFDRLGDLVSGNKR